jgi:hypothetical protein
MAARLDELEPVVSASGRYLRAKGAVAPAPAVTSAPMPGSPSAMPAVGGWLTVRDAEARFAVSYPSAWFRASTTLTPELSDPREILAVASYPLRPGAPPDCAQYPVKAIQDLGPTDALLWVGERRAEGSFRPRRGLFLRSDLRATDESPACLRQPKVFFHGITNFEDRGRDFEAYVAWGRDASAETWRRLLAVLDSLQFDPEPLAPPRPRCGMLSPAGPEYNTVMLPRRGVPGDEIVLSGPTLRGEDGRFFPADRLEVWFNTSVPTSEVPNASPIAAAPILHLVTVEDIERCTFSTHFAVPDVPPGRYKIFDFVFWEGGYGGGSHFLTVR